MAYEYAISAGPGTLMDYGAVETWDDLHWEYAEASNFERTPNITMIFSYTDDYHDCETGR